MQKWFEGPFSEDSRKKPQRGIGSPACKYFRPKPHPVVSDASDASNTFFKYTVKQKGNAKKLRELEP